MELTVNRKELTEHSTIGEMLIDGQFLCYTLEDTVREPSVKIPGETAIPPGRYEVIINFSNRFRQLMPLLLNVPMFEGVRIHKGNWAKDTEGCILLGMSKAEDMVGRSDEAFKKFFPLLQSALKEGKVYITVG